MEPEIITETTPSAILPIGDEYRVYLIVNTDLKMSIGKTAAQVGHAVQYLLTKRDEILGRCDLMHGYAHYNLDKSCFDTALLFNAWYNSPSHTKIVLAANVEQFNQIKSAYEHACVVVRDAGRTEIASGSETVIGLFPMKKSERSELLKELKTL